ncbi:MAG: hypothetical protein IKS28_06180 [Clostridia bacterium]|nr:hypothetical protein [Clostridia bacterium]
MSEVSKYLKLARTAREEGNTEDAKRYYDMVRTDEPENGEAKFFYSFYSLYEGTNGEIPKKFSNLCGGMKSSIKMVKDSDCTDEEKIRICNAILDAFIPETWSENRYMNKKNHETKVGDSYVNVFTSSQIASVSKEGMKTLRDIGDYVATLFESSPEGMNMAVKAWKEYVTLAQKWYSWAPKGEAEVYAAKIQKIEPSYVLPKKAGCISFGDKR